MHEHAMPTGLAATVHDSDGWAVVFDTLVLLRTTHTPSQHDSKRGSLFRLEYDVSVVAYYRLVLLCSIGYNA